jgi:hypothetical protein
MISSESIRGTEAWTKAKLRANGEDGVVAGIKQQSRKVTDQGVLELPLDFFQDLGWCWRLGPAQLKRASQRPLWAWFQGLC